MMNNAAPASATPSKIKSPGSEKTDDEKSTLPSDFDCGDCNCDDFNCAAATFSEFSTGCGASACAVASVPAGVAGALCCVCCAGCVDVCDDGCTDDCAADFDDGCDAVCCD